MRKNYPLASENVLQNRSKIYIDCESSKRSECADKHARQGYKLDGALPKDVKIPLNTLKRIECLEFVSNANARWKILSTYYHIRHKTKQLIALPRQDIAKALALYTKHWPV